MELILSHYDVVLEENWNSNKRDLESVQVVIWGLPLSNKKNTIKEE